MELDRLRRQMTGVGGREEMAGEIEREVGDKSKFCMILKWYIKSIYILFTHLQGLAKLELILYTYPIGSVALHRSVRKASVDRAVLKIL